VLALDERPRTCRHAPAQLRVTQRPLNLPGERHARRGQQHFAFVGDVDALDSQWRGDDAAAQRHRLEHLVTGATSGPERNDRKLGAPIPRDHVLDPSEDLHMVPGQPPDGGRRPVAHDHQTDSAHMLAQPWKGGATEVDHRIGLGG
jgi:hypothetical protein